MNIKDLIRTRERGSAAIELIFAAPIVLTLAAMGLNLQTYIQQAMRADAAATAAARYVMDHAEEPVNELDLCEYLNETFPELGFEEGRAAVGLDQCQESSAQYSYHLYRGENPETFIATSSSRRFTVTVAAQRQWPALAKLMSSSDGSFIVTANKSGECDTSDGSTWEPLA